MTQSSKALAPKKGGKLKEFFRKRIVSLKRKPQTIAFLVLIIGFVYYSLNMTIISHTTSLVQNGTGLSAFVTMLFSTLTMVSFLRTYPKRKKANVPMLILTVVMILITVAAECNYHQLIVNGITSPRNNYLYDTSDKAVDKVARNIVSTAAKQKDSEASQKVKDTLYDKNGEIIPEQLTALISSGTITIDEDKLTNSKGEYNTRNIDKAIDESTKSMVPRLYGEDGKTLDLAALKTAIDDGSLGISRQLFKEDGTPDLEAVNAASLKVTGTAQYAVMHCRFSRTEGEDGRLVFGENHTYLIASNFGYIAQAHQVILVHVIFLLVSLLLIATMPLYSKLIRKINTSVQVEENTEMEAIDISGED